MTSSYHKILLKLSQTVLAVSALEGERGREGGRETEEERETETERQTEFKGNNSVQNMLPDNQELVFLYFALQLSTWWPRPSV